MLNLEKNTIVIVPAYNELQNLKKILPKLKKKYNILVIDYGSSDGTCAFLKKKKLIF